MLTRVIYNNYEFDPPKKLGWLRRYLLVKIHTLSDPSKSFTFYVLCGERLHQVFLMLITISCIHSFL